MPALRGSFKTVYQFFKTLWFNHLGIRRKIIYAYALAVCITLLGTFTGLAIGNFYYNQVVEQRNLAHTETLYLNHLRAATLETISHQHRLGLLVSNPQKFQLEYVHFKKHIFKVNELFIQLKSQSSNANNSVLEEFLRTYNGVPVTYLQNVESVLQPVDSGQLPTGALLEVQQALLTLNNHPIALRFEQLSEDLAVLVTAAENKESQADAALERAEKLRIQIISLNVLVAIIIVLVLSYYTSWAIASPLETVSKIARQAKEEATFNWQIPITTEDEVGQLSHVLNRLSQQMSVHTQALKTSEERFRLLVAGVKDYAIIMLDPKGYIVSWNLGAEKIMGYLAHEIVGQHFSRFYRSQEIELGKPEDELQIATSEGRYEDEGWRIRKDGSLFWVSTVITALRNDEGELHGFAEVTRDITERKQAEAFVQFQAKILSQVNDAVIAIDNAELITYWNSGAEKLYGFKSQEVLGQKLETIVLYQWLQPEDQQLANESLRTTGFWHGENIHFMQSGKQLFVESSVSTLKDDNGIKLGLLAVVRDITERKQVEAALRASESRFRQLFESNIIGMIFADIHGNIIEANDAFLEILGYTKEDLRAGLVRWHELTPPEYRYLDEQAIAEVRKSGVCTPYEKENIRKDGTRVPLLVGGASLEGCTNTGIGFVLDLTERKQAEEALRQSEERFRSLSACSPVGIFLTDTQGYCIYTNPRLQAIAGFNLEESLGAGWLRFIHPEEREQVFADWLLCAGEGKEYTNEYRFQTPEGIVRWVDVHSSPMFSDAGELIGHVGTVEDITERKQVESEIRKSLEKEKELSDLKSRFITTTSHEFRTPLSIIASSAELFEYHSSKLDEAKKLKHLHRIQAAVKYMTQLLEDVLLINRAELGRLEFNPTPVDLGKFCQELVEELELGMNTNHAIAFQNGCPNSFSPQMDEKLLRQILNNLLSNAIKYSPANSAIHFDVACQGESIIFRVRDEGIGIPAEDEAHLFESFHRAKNVGNTPGTGLGLAIVKKCVDLYNGEIAVTSELGVGTTFTVSIPVIQS